MTTSSALDLPIVPHFIGGQWIRPENTSRSPVFNPSRGEAIGTTPHGDAATVDAAVQAAQTAFLSWGSAPPPKRAAILFRFRDLLEANFADLARLVVRENGKTLEEAKGDVRRGIEVVEFACGISHLLKGESLPQVAEQIDAVTMRELNALLAGRAEQDVSQVLPPVTEGFIAPQLLTMMDVFQGSGSQGALDDLLGEIDLDPVSLVLPSSGKDVSIDDFLDSLI